MRAAPALDRTIFWAPWSGPGLEHLHLRATDGGYVANGVILGVADNRPFRLHYKVKCDSDWRTLAGEPKTYVRTAESGATSHQLFCPECASPLYSTSIGDGPKFFNLRVGTARQRAELRPKTQYWCRSAQAWVADLGPAKKFDTQ